VQLPARQRSSDPHPGGPSLPLSKACDVHDFSNPELAEWIRRIFPHEAARFGPRFPKGVEYRKHWEVAMTARALEAGGALRPDAELLGVGAGNEPTIFWLTTMVRRVFATDLYMEPGWEESANASMLTDPGRHWSGPWNARRLVVQHMNALDLQYEDASFDGIFSSSSIEHFGGHAEVRRAVDEMHRVLRPGGTLALATELRLAGPGPGLPGTQLFDPAELLELVVGDRGWEPFGPLDADVCAVTSAGATSFSGALADLDVHVAEHGRLDYETLRWSRYPHVVLEHGAHRWTSVHLCLRRAAA
jgi:SAM-dependent methyltransferase